MTKQIQPKEECKCVCHKGGAFTHEIEFCPACSPSQEWEKELTQKIRYMSLGDIIRFTRSLLHSQREELINVIKGCAKEQSCSMCKEAVSGLEELQK